MSEWKDCVLADVTTGRGEYGIAASAVEYSRDKYTYLRITDIKDDGTIDFSGLKSVDEPNASRYLLEPNDIVFARTGASTGRSYFYDGRDGQFVYAGFLIKFSLDPIKVFPRYVKYHCLFEGYRAWVSQTMTGSTRGNINAVTLGQMPLRLPSLPTQRKIAAVLGALDDKIELNRKMNANLEAMAQALFKSWFVDFEPFGGTKPEGWREGTLGEIVKVMETGSRPKGGALQDGIPSIGAENVEGLGLYNYASDKYVSQEFFDRLKRGKVASGDVLLYKDGAYTGKVSMALDGFPHKVAAVNEHVFILRTEECKYQSYLYCLLKRSDMYKAINTLASSKAAQPGLNQTELSSVEIVVPAEDMIAVFEGIVSPLLHKMAANANQSRTLAQLRDALLPKLMSGELDVEAVQVEA